MVSAVRPRRSALFVPGINERALEKARALPADVVIMDLEDSVAPDHKAQARTRIRAAVDSGGYGSREIVVRINGVSTQWWEDDLDAVAGSGIHAVLLPKVDRPDEVRRVAETVDRNVSVSTRLWIMAETPRGVLHLDAIAGADPRVECVVVGTEDLGSAMRVPGSPQRPGLLHALSACVLVARAHDLDILDSVYPAIGDPDGLGRSCEQGRMLGFDGKTLIHPSQIAVANEVFHPRPGELDAARAIVTAWEQRAPDQAVIVVNDAMVEHLHVRAAQRLLALHAAVDTAGSG